MSEKKPGFLEGVMAGLEGKNREIESPQVTSVKNFVNKLELTAKERGDLAAWLLGEAVRSSIISALEDQPPAE